MRKRSGMEPDEDDDAKAESLCVLGRGLVLVGVHGFAPEYHVGESLTILG